MKRFLAISVTLVLLCSLLTGCCVSHDMKPATCTEPATCSKCGKTSGEPLGHTVELDPAKEPTCTETGLTEGSHCAVCGEILKAQTELPALGHSEEPDPVKEATCTEAGLTGGSHCAVCGVTLKEAEEVPALGHTEETDPAKEPTCTETGLTEGSHCAVCGEILKAQEELPALGHTEETDPAKEPTCTETGLTEGSHCAVCGEILKAQEELPALGHTEEIGPAKEPTCTETGLTEGSHCAVCGEILKAQEELPALGHTEEIDPAKEPTCTETGLTEGSHCAVCGEILKAQRVIPALGHDWEEASFSKPRTCRACGETEGEALETAVITAVGVNGSFESAPDANQKNAKIERFFKTLVLNGWSEGFDELDSFLADSALQLTLDTREENKLVLSGEAIIEGSEPKQCVLSADENGITFALPGYSEKIWHISPEAAQEMFGSYPLPVPAAKTEKPGTIDLEARNLLNKYVRILLGVLNADNTVTANRAYDLELLGTAEDCVVLRAQPSAEEWQRVLETVYNTAMEDQELAGLLKKAAKLSNTVNSSLGSEEADGESMVDDFHEILTEALKDVEYTAGTLSELSYEIAFREKRIHAVKLLDKEGILAAYESTGTPEEERADAVMFRSAGEDVHLVRFVSERDGLKTGKFIAPEIGLTAETTSWKAENGETRFEWNLDIAGNKLDLSLLDEKDSALLRARLESLFGNGEIDVLITDAEGEIVLPEGEITEISSEEELAAIFQKLTENSKQKEPAA